MTIMPAAPFFSSASILHADPGDAGQPGKPANRNAFAAKLNDGPVHLFRGHLPHITGLMYLGNLGDEADCFEA